MPEIQVYQSTEDSDGTKTSPLLEVTGFTIGNQNYLHVNSTIIDNPEVFEDTSFVVGDSPANLDVNTTLGRNGTQFMVWNDGAGDFTVSASTDGITFGGAHTMKVGEVYAVDNISVDTLRITHVANSAYRVVIL